MSIITILGEAYKDLDGYLLFLAGIALSLIFMFLFRFTLERSNSEESNEENPVDHLNGDMKHMKGNEEFASNLQRTAPDLEDNVLDENVIFIDSRKILNYLESTLFEHLQLNLNSDCSHFDSNEDNKGELLRNNGEELNKIIIEAQIKCELRKFIQNYVQGKKRVVLETNRVVFGAKDITDEVMDKFILHLNKTDILKWTF